MHIDEIWRLEQSKVIIVNSVVDLLKVKMKMWENLSSGESGTLNKFIRDVLQVSKQLDISREVVVNVLDDFDNDVRRSYTYYHKYQSFLSLFFDCNYKKAALYQRKMEDAW